MVKKEFAILYIGKYPCQLDLMLPCGWRLLLCDAFDIQIVSSPPKDN